tara:strand:- start:2657 stop:3661 length:1005 start_codon:yes stop_codon:yes gene_type:complete
MNHNLTEITPYKISERIFSPDMAYLDWNEGYDLPEEIKAKIKEEIEKIKLNQYPDPKSTELRRAISKYTEVDESFIHVFNGSDSALDHSFRVLLNLGDTVCIPYPNYSQINQTIVSIGAKIEYCDINSIEESIIQNSQIKVVYLSNPNNPIGYLYDVQPLILKYPDIYFVVDEAYYEFSKQYSMFKDAYKYPNVIVTRTFSKALSLASLRLGYLTTNSYIMNQINKIKNFKEVNTLAQVSGKVILDHISLIENNIIKMKEVKRDFLKKIKGVRVYDSHANFVLIEHPRVKKIIEELKDEKILVRDRSDYIKSTLRITIGSFEKMQIIADVINGN